MGARDGRQARPRDNRRGASRAFPSGNAYSVPWRLIGERVRVTISGSMLRVRHAGHEVAVHRRYTGRFERIIDPLHFEGVVGFRTKATGRATNAAAATEPGPPESELLRPLIEYERLAGGRW